MASLLRMMAILAAATAASAGVSVVHAYEDEVPVVIERPQHRDFWRFDSYWENDGGPLKRNAPRDRYYTSGVAFSLAHRPQWAERLGHNMPFARQFGPARTAAGYTAGQLMFTPRDIEIAELQEDDRPYAGYLFGGVYWQRANEHTLDHVQLNLGLVGPSSAADDTQEIVHDLTSAPEPQGWNHQLRDEPTIQLYVRKKWRHPLARVPTFGRQLDVQWVPSVAGALGTVYRHAETGSMLRAGWNLPNDFGPGRVRDVAAATGDPQRGFGVYGYVRGNVRFVQHNIFLHGNTWKDSHSVRARPVVGEAQVGFVLQYRNERWATQFGYSQIYQTDEFYGQRGDGHGFGSLVLSLSYWF